MNLFKKLTIKNKLTFATILVIGTLSAFLFVNLKNEFAFREEAKQALDNASEMKSISSVLSAIHNEQAVSLTYISSNGTKEFALLSLRREATDDAISAFNKLFITLHVNNNEKNVSFKELELCRAGVNELKLFSRMDSMYDQINIRLLDQFSGVVISSNDSKLNSLFEAHYTLWHAGDDVSKMKRSVGNALLLGSFEGRAFADYTAIKADYQNNVRNYKIEASPELKDYFEQKYQGVFVDQFTEIIDSVYLDPTFANLNYTFENWWATSSAAFNQLKEVEKYSADLITEKQKVQRH